jgi:hypothetical protein
MFRQAVRQQTSGIEITIYLDVIEPPTGRIMREDETGPQAIAFAGWLELLAVLPNFLRSTEPRPGRDAPPR